MKNYQHNCKQYVKNNRKSQISTILHGVLQGSVLGPLLNLLYLNGFTKTAENSQITTFAHNTAKSDKSYSNLVANQVSNLAWYLLAWLYSNKLTLNVKRCKLFYYGKRQVKKCFKLFDQPTEETNSFKYLGVHFDTKLSFKDHVDYVCKKLAKFNGILYRARNFITKTSLTKWYNTYAKPVILYRIFSYDPTSWSHLDRIFLPQKRIFRTNCFKKNFDSSNFFIQWLRQWNSFWLLFQGKETICHRPLDLFSDFYVASFRTTRVQVGAQTRSQITKTTTQKRSLENSKNLMYDILIRLNVLLMEVELLGKTEIVHLSDHLSWIIRDTCVTIGSYYHCFFNHE